MIEQKRKILETSSHLMITRGIKSVTMDDIANTAGVSKRTIYEIFENKDALVRALFMENVGRTEPEALPPMTQAMERLLALMDFNLEQTMRICPQFYIDMRRHYSRVWEEYQNTYRDRATEESLKLLNAGISQGVFRAEMDLDVLVTLLLEIPTLLFANTPFSFSKYPIERVLFLINELVSWGIATPLGIQKLQAYRQAHALKRN